MKEISLWRKEDQPAGASLSWPAATTITRKAALAFSMAGLIGLLAQVRILLPGTPVPVVLSQLGLMISGAVLGRAWAGVSAALYLLIGLAGLPWFAGFGGGLSVLAGPTGGYILGYLPAACLIGQILGEGHRARQFLPTAMALFGALQLIYLPGLIQLGHWLSRTAGHPIGTVELLTVGYLPFLAGDLGKALLGTTLFMAGKRIWNSKRH